MKTPLSIIVVTFNTRDLTIRCIENFYDDAVAAGWEIISVDNGSADGTAQAVSARFPAVRVIRAEANRG